MASASEDDPSIGEFLEFLASLEDEDVVPPLPSFDCSACGWPSKDVVFDHRSRARCNKCVHEGRDCQEDLEARALYVYSGITGELVHKVVVNNMDRVKDVRTVIAESLGVRAQILHLLNLKGGTLHDIQNISCIATTESDPHVASEGSNVPSQVHMTFQAGQTGLKISKESGLVCDVMSGTRGHDLGVQMGWSIDKIDGTAYNPNLMQDLPDIGFWSLAGETDVMFVVPSKIVTVNFAARKLCKMCLSLKFADEVIPDDADAVQARALRFRATCFACREKEEEWQRRQALRFDPDYHSCTGSDCCICEEKEFFENMDSDRWEDYCKMMRDW